MYSTLHIHLHLTVHADVQFTWQNRWLQLWWYPLAVELQFSETELQPSSPPAVSCALAGTCKTGYWHRSDLLYQFYHCDGYRTPHPEHNTSNHVHVKPAEMYCFLHYDNSITSDACNCNRKMNMNMYIIYTYMYKNGHVDYIHACACTCLK